MSAAESYRSRTSRGFSSTRCAHAATFKGTSFSRVRRHRPPFSIFRSRPFSRNQAVDCRLSCRHRIPIRRACRFCGAQPSRRSPICDGGGIILRSGGYSTCGKKTARPQIPRSGQYFHSPFIPLDPSRDKANYWKLSLQGCTACVSAFWSGLGRVRRIDFRSPGCPERDKTSCSRLSGA